MRIVLYIAIAFILWRIYRTMTSSAPAPPQVRDAQRSERVEAPRGPDIDYSRVRDAEWREGDPPRRREQGDGEHT